MNNMNKTGVERALERGKHNVGRKLNQELRKEVEQDLINFEKHKISPLAFFVAGILMVLFMTFKNAFVEFGYWFINYISNLF